MQPAPGPAGDRPAERVVTRTVLAEAVSRVGDAISLVALPLTAILILDASPAELALIGAAQALPILVLSLPTGAWVDRRSRRWPLLIGADLTRAGLLASIPLMAALNLLSIPALAVVGLLVSAAGTFFDLALAGWLPRLLSGDHLHRANARIELARSSALVVGPAVGGALVAAVTAPVALLGDALSFVLSALLVASVRDLEPPHVVAAPAGVRGQLFDGLRFVARQPVIRAITATAAINNLSRAIAMGIAVLYLVDAGGLSPAEIGLAFGVGSAGYLAGAAAARSLSKRLGMGWTMQLGVGLFGPSMLLFAAAPPELIGVTFTAMFFANGFGIAVHNVNQVTLRQTLTPDHLRARAAAVFRLVIFGALPVGMTIGGLVGEAFGLRTAIVLSGLGMLVGSLPYLAVRIVRLRTMADVADAAPAEPITEAAGA
jgi:MFS family permease